MKPVRFEISQTDEVLVSHSGLALIGSLLSKTALKKQINTVRIAGRPRPEISHFDTVLSMISLLCLAKPDFDAVEPFRQDEFFKRSLGIKAVPSSATMRQRLDDLAQVEDCFRIIAEQNRWLLNQHTPVITSSYQEWVPLDIDVSPFDNSGTKKEGVSYTYKKVDGYAPIFAYLGLEGYMVHCQLREGSQHSQHGTPQFLTEALDMAKRITDRAILVRMDAGNDDVENLEICRKDKRVDWIIKRNIRKESVDEWLLDAQCFGQWSFPREGKEVYIGHTQRERAGRLYRVVFEITKRTSTTHGQMLLLPEIEVATYWTSLSIAPEKVIELYHQHGTSEQFHSEVKTDMDLERLPSGKFATNALVLQLGMLAYNLLRIVGQSSLLENRMLPPGQRTPIRDSIKRRRLKTVIQDLMYMACRLTRHAKRWGLSFWRGNAWMPVWHAVYRRIQWYAPSQ
ncbi:MAG: IS1380 family transposase [Deltaproteobacteria bacterium]|nr:IS1380 family transposase [Deltaproteobacteria bacterium]